MKSGFLCLCCFLDVVVAFFHKNPSHVIRKSFKINAKLLKNPQPNAIGNFFETKDDGSSTFIQCFMLSLAEIGTEQFGVGFPVDMVR